MAQQHVIPMKSLLEAGVHFGHRTPRWNPKMKQYIFTQRNGIHIIDLQQTLRYIDQAYQLAVETAANGGLILFVGTKRQAQDSIQEEAERCGMPYVNERWLGGTLTNWRTIRQRIDYMLELEKQQTRGEFSRLVKKEALQKEKEITRLDKRFGGLRNMRHLPHLVFITDVRRETIAVKESNVLGIPILALVDTNCDPDPIDHIIPSNDDAIRAIRLITSKIADAVLEGRAVREAEEAEVEEIEAIGDEDISRYLGPSTLAHLKAAAGTAEGEDETEADEAEQAVVAEAATIESDVEPESQDGAESESNVEVDAEATVNANAPVEEDADDAEVEGDADAPAEAKAVVEEKA